MLLIAGEPKAVLELKHVHGARVAMLVCGERQPESAAFAHNLVEFLEPPVYRPVIGVAPTSVGASAVSWLGRRHCDHRSDCYYATRNDPDCRHPRLHSRSLL